MENLPGTKTRTANTYYWGIFNGKFSRKAKEGDEGAHQRTNKKNTIVWEFYVDTLEGKLVDMHITDSDYGQQLNVEITPQQGFKYIINIPVASRYFSTLLERLPDLRAGEVVELTPYSFESEGRKQTGITVKKNNVKLPSAYKVKDADGKNKYLLDYPPFPENWGELKEMDKKIYFLKTEDFLMESLKKWRLENDNKSNFVTESDDDTLKVPQSNNNPDDSGLPF